MLTEIYIEALLVDEDLADRIWEAWYAGLIDDQAALIAWRVIAKSIHLSSISERRPMTIR